MRQNLKRTLLVLLSLGLVLVVSGASFARWIVCYPLLKWEWGVPAPIPYSEYWSAPLWTPDGAHIVFATTSDQRHPSKIHITSSDGLTLSAMSEDYGSGPSISPDGSRIAYSFFEGDPGNYDERRPDFALDAYENVRPGIKITELDGSQGRRLTKGVDPDSAASWSPDGEYISFMRGGSNRCRLLFLSHKPSGLFRVEPDGSGGRKIVSPDALISLQDSDAAWGIHIGGGPVWSPDGKLAFIGRQAWPSNYGPIQRDIYTVRVDGSDLRKLFTFPSEGIGELGKPWTEGQLNSIVSPLAPSPDGQRIAFIGRHYGRLKLYAIALHDANLLEVADTGIEKPYKAIGYSLTEFESGSVDWSPNGRQLLFTFRNSLYVVDEDGSDLRYIGEGVYAAWSPNGSRIASVVFDADGSHAMLYTMAPDGSDARVLVRREDDGVLRSGGYETTVPSPNPQGNRILTAMILSSPHKTGIRPESENFSHLRDRFER